MLQVAHRLLKHLQLQLHVCALQISLHVIVVNFDSFVQIDQGKLVLGESDLSTSSIEQDVAVVLII